MTAGLAPSWTIALCAAFGFAAVYLLLPRPRRLPVWWGVAAGLVALVLTGCLLFRPAGLWPEMALFYIFSAVAIVSGVMLIAQTNPARAALSFALVVLSTCGLFLLQAAPFLMAATAIIYAGAIIVTFLFVLMLAQQEGRSDADERSREPLLASAAGFVLLAVLVFVLLFTYENPQTEAGLAQLDRVLTRVADADENDPPRINGDQFFDQLLQTAGRLPAEPALTRLDDAIKKQQEAWFDQQMAQTPQRRDSAMENRRFLQVSARKIREDVQRARHTLGDLQPDGKAVLAPYSGPPANEPVLYDAHGNAPVPAENTAHLGRSLFTDYLLAVELGGTLLLVATIGAIAIAARRQEAA